MCRRCARFAGCHGPLSTDCRTAGSSELRRVCRSPVGQMWAGLLRKVRKLRLDSLARKLLPSDQASALARHRPGDRCFAVSESSKYLHWSVLFRWVSMGLISPETLSLTMRRAAPLDFQELARAPALYVAGSDENGGSDGTRTRGLCRDSSLPAKTPSDTE